MSVLISVKELDLMGGAKPLLNSASFSLHESERVAIVGVNGSGKSSLLDWIYKGIKNPVPEMHIKSGTRVSFLGQSVAFDGMATIRDYLLSGDSAQLFAIRAYEQAISAADSERIEDAIRQMDASGAWVYEDRLKSILLELRIPPVETLLGRLSGGMAKKIGLAKVLLDPGDLLILDEPTNHLDVETIGWLERQLKRIDATLLMVTHDRYFLNQVCNRIIEIDQRALFSYDGNYERFLGLRDERYRVLENADQRVQSILRGELEWLRRGPKARSTKQRARKDRIQQMVDRKQYVRDQALSLEIAHTRLGKKIVAFKDVSKTFGSRIICQNFSYEFKAGEKIGILGPNGSGKTTLVNMMVERLVPDSGVVDVGVNTQFGYFEQSSVALDPDQTIYEHVKAIGEQIRLSDGTSVSASQLLERFLFPSQQLKTPIRQLSGGERRRLQLVCLLLSNPNFLVFDEPTNDFDTVTLAALESFLLEFQGCVVVISHDRYFMDRVVDHLVVLDGQGGIGHFWGGYTDYIQTISDLEAIEAQLARSSALVPKRLHDGPSRKANKLSFKETRELAQLEVDIAALESEQATLTAWLSGIDCPDGLAYGEIGNRLGNLEDELNIKMTRWETLAERAQ